MRLGRHPEPRIATPEMVAVANPPEGYEPIVSNSPFGWENGPLFERRDGGRIFRGFRVADRHINAGGACHGGMIMTFADILLASAVFQAADAPLVTVRLTTDFTGPAFKGDWLEGRAYLTGMDDGLVAATGDMYVDDRSVASVSGIFKQVRPRA